MSTSVYGASVSVSSMFGAPHRSGPAFRISIDLWDSARLRPVSGPCVRKPLKYQQRHRGGSMNKPRLRTALAAALLAVTVTGTSVATGTAASAAPAPAAPSAATAGAAPDAAPVAQNALGTLTSEVTGTFTDANGGAGTFTGTFTPSTFAAVGNQIQSTGVLTGNMVNSDGTSQPVLQSQTFAVTQLDPVGCQVLDLVLAP